MLRLCAVRAQHERAAIHRQPGKKVIRSERLSNKKRPDREGSGRLRCRTDQGRAKVVRFTLPSILSSEPLKSAWLVVIEATREFTSSLGTLSCR